MPVKPDLQPIIELNDALLSQHYPDQVTALQLLIPQQLQRLITVSEQTVFSKAINTIVHSRIISCYRESLAKIQLLNEKGDYSYASEFIKTFRHDMEIARLFFEGINQYLSEIYHTFFPQA